MDVKTTFLNGILKEEIYMKVPQGINADKIETELCLVLNRHLNTGMKDLTTLFKKLVSKAVLPMHGYTF